MSYSCWIVGDCNAKASKGDVDLCSVLPATDGHDRGSNRE